MASVAAICTQCGASIEVDNTKEAGICSYCGNAFVTEKVINKYSQTFNISNANINVTGGNIENLRKIGDEAFLREDYEEAYKYYTKVIEMDFDDYERKFKRLLSAALESTLNECEQIQHLVLEVKSYCESVKEDSVLESNEKLDKISDGFINVHRVINSMYNTTYDIYFNNGKSISSTHEELIHYLEMYFNMIFELLNIMKEYINLYPQCVKIYNEACDSAVVALERFARSYLDDPRDTKKMSKWNKEGKQKSQNIANSVCELRKKTTPDYQIPKKLKQLLNIGGCYIATAVYGSYDCPEVWVLRRYRDNYLSKAAMGRLFIKIYYRISPTIVKWFGDKLWFNKLWRNQLDRAIINLKNNGYEDSPYQD